MLADAIKTIVGLGQAARSLEVLTHPSLPDQLFVRHGDQLIEHRVPPPPRNPTLIGLSDLVEMLGNPDIAQAPEVYVGPTAVVAFLDNTGRDERVTMPLTESARFRLCQDIERQPRAYAPRDLVRFLRQTLWGVDASVIQSLSRIDFTRTSTGKTDVRHGRETLGRTVEAVVQQAEQVPESFTVSVPIWTTPGCAWQRSIEFGIYLDVEKGAVELSVLSDSCTTARNGALSDLRNAIEESCPNAPVFMGAP